ncbi:MAG: NADH-quinone oxidoreductase subunit M [Acidimicrobiia bacterium]|nr:NADH-quinone oxidoreductase subunit M [Acidimicrobiia bacterium]MDH3469914.1 NADH-quinone oxidoreductase subunit M [Acidimicrobiia bacterium]
MDFPILTAIVGVPAAAAVLVALVPRRELVLPVAITLSFIPLALAGWLTWEFAVGEAGFQFVEKVLWFEPWGISYHLGVDGISLFLVLLTAFLIPVALVASHTITDRTKVYIAAMLALQSGLFGVFLSLDLLLFFVFFEVVLVPMYFIIGVWGGERRVYAAIKFFLFTAFGSALLLIGILSLAVIASDQTGSPTFDFVELLSLDISRTTQFWLFGAFALAFGIKVPLFPLHTWLPDAHVEAPTAGSVILAGVLLKLGTYGLLRFNLTLFPEATVKFVPVLAVLAVIGIIYGAVVAIVQPDLKRLVAYSSVSHLGFVVLGIFALTRQGLQGGVLQMINHGLTTGALFLLVGMIYERRHTRQIADYGGIAKVMPLFAGFFLFTAFASIGLPGLNGFVGEFLVLIGSYLSLPAAAIVASFGVVLAAIYLLWAYERVFTGPIDKPENEGLRDLTLREWSVLVPIAVLVLWLGIYPRPALDRIEPSVDAILQRIEATTDYEVPDFGELVAIP